MFLKVCRSLIIYYHQILFTSTLFRSALWRALLTPSSDQSDGVNRPDDGIETESAIKNIQLNSGDVVQGCNNRIKKIKANIWLSYLAERAERFESVIKKKELTILTYFQNERC